MHLDTTQLILCNINFSFTYDLQIDNFFYLISLKIHDCYHIQVALLSFKNLKLKNLYIWFFMADYLDLLNISLISLAYMI